MHETALQTAIRLSTQPLYDRIERLEKRFKELQILCEVVQEHAWKDPKCSALFTTFITKMNSMLRRD